MLEEPLFKFAIFLSFHCARCEYRIFSGDSIKGFSFLKEVLNSDVVRRRIEPWENATENIHAAPPSS